MGLLVDGEGLWTTKRKMEGGRTGCKLSPRAWSVCVSGGGRLSVMGCRACADLVLCLTGQYVGPPTTWPQKCC